MSDTPEQAAQQMAAAAMSTYRTRGERAALRCALSDAAVLCDEMARKVAADHRGRGGRGKTTRHGQDLAATLKLAGDEIWKLRELIEVLWKRLSALPVLAMSEGHSLPLRGPATYG